MDALAEDSWIHISTPVINPLPYGDVVEVCEEK